MAEEDIGWCVWITGLPGSGKSIVSLALLEKLRKRGIQAQLLSSDMLRKILTPEPTYSLAERDVVYGTVVFITKLLTQNAVNVIVDATGNLRKYRDKAREENRFFMEVYLQCPTEICIQREIERKEVFNAPPKIYKKAFTGNSATVPGFGAPYEEPLRPEVTVESDKLDPDQCAQKILDTLKKVFL